MKITVKKTRVLLDLSNREVKTLAALVRHVDRARRSSPISWLLEKPATLAMHEQLSALVEAFEVMAGHGLHGPLADEEKLYSPVYAGTLDRLTKVIGMVRPRYKGQKRLGGFQSKITVETVAPAGKKVS